METQTLLMQAEHNIEIAYLNHSPHQIQQQILKLKMQKMIIDSEIRELQKVYAIKMQPNFYAHGMNKSATVPNNYPAPHGFTQFN